MRPEANLLSFLVLMLSSLQLSANPTNPPPRLVQFNEFTKSDQHSLTIAASPTRDRLMGVWVSRQQNNHGPGVYARVYGDAWSVVRPEYPLFDDDPNCANPTVVATPDGFVAAWEVQGSGDAVVKARAFDRNGQPRTPPVELARPRTRFADPCVMISGAGLVGVVWRSAGTVQGAWLNPTTLQPRDRWSVVVGSDAPISSFSPITTDAGVMIGFGVEHGVIGVICAEAGELATLVTWAMPNAVEPTLWNASGLDGSAILSWTEAAGSDRLPRWGIVQTDHAHPSSPPHLLVSDASAGDGQETNPLVVAWNGSPVVLVEVETPDGDQFVRFTHDGNALLDFVFSSNMLQPGRRSGQQAFFGDEIVTACWGRFEPDAATGRGDDRGVGVFTVPLSALMPPSQSVAHGNALLLREAREPIEWPEERDVEPADPIKLSENGEPGFMVSENPNGLAPADPAIAVGPGANGQILTVVNTQVFVHDKQGNALCSWNLNDLFGNCCPTGGWGAVDPVAVFDPYSEKFVIAAMTRGTSVGNRIGLAFSKSTGTLSCNQGTTFSQAWDVLVWADDPSIVEKYDYPKLGFTEGHIFITYMTIDNADFERTRVVVYDRATGSFLPQAFDFGLRNGNFPVMPTRDHDAGDIQYLVTEYTNGKSIALAAIYPHPTTGQLVMTSEWAAVDVDRYLQPFSMKQANTGFRLPVRRTLSNHAVKRGGHLWYAFTASGPAPDTTPRVRWYRINTNGWPLSGLEPTLAHEGVLDLGSQVATAFPGIAVGNGGPTGQRAVLVYARSSPEEPMSIGRSVIDTGGTVLDSGVWKSSAAPATAFRWGDYFSVEPDPTDPDVFWGHGQYQGLTAWRTWVGRVDLDDL